MYEIRQENDLLAGVSLIATIEENELDKKAFCTISDTKPGFVLPFRARYVDGKIEFKYQVTTLCKLQYITGDYTVKEYVELWRSILYPLLECEDWFMKTQSFVLDAEHLYYDKDKKNVSYVYIPSERNCSGYEDLKKMTGELAKQISVTDMVLENKVLRMIMNGFKPKDLLNMLNEYIPEMETPETLLQGKALSSKQPHGELPPTDHSRTKIQPISSALKEIRTNTSAIEPIIPLQADNAFEAGNEKYGDIVINMQSDGKERKNKKEKKSSSKREKRKKKDTKNLSSIDIAKYAGTEKQSDISFNKKIKNEKLLENVQHNSTCNAQLMLEDEPLEDESFDDATQCVNLAGSACTLRLIGSPLLPSLISVQIEEGEVFTIGRFDATVGRKQSSFEFERKTKAVSRRHAAIERHRESYSLIDLSSSAGTFVNGKKLPPNTPIEMQNGSRISFGTSGADYVWEG